MGSYTQHNVRALRNEFNLTKKQFEHYKCAFDMFDVDRTGNITAIELVAVMAKVGVEITVEGATDLISKIDLNGDGIIDLREFICLILECNKSGPDEEELRIVFDIFDSDNNGYIDMEELKNVLANLTGTVPTEDEVQKLMQAVDTNKDGRISFEEFKICMCDNKFEK